MTNKKNYWMIDGLESEFDSLWHAKNHFSFYSIKERIAQNGGQILHIVDDDVVSIVEVRCNDKGVMSFGKTITISTLFKKLGLE